MYSGCGRGKKDVAMEFSEDVREKAFAMFREGKSTNAVAGALFKKYWIPAKALKDEFLAQGGQVEKPAKEAGKKRGGKKSAEVESETDAYDLKINVPVGRAEAIFETFTDQEKMTAVQSVLQSRVDELQEQ